MKRVFVVLVAIALGVTLFSNVGKAEYVINIVQSGNDVIATGSGSLNLKDLLLIESDFFSNSRISGVYGFATVGGGNSDTYFGKSGHDISGPDSIGNSFSFYDSNLESGSLVGIGGGYGTPRLLTPKDYISGSDLGTSTATWTSDTFSSLGITPGTYTWTWGSGANADSFVLNINSVPEPSSYALMALGIVCLAAGYGYRRRMAVVAA